MMFNEETLQFIIDHAHEDVKKLALKGCKQAAVDLQAALQQIAGRQAAQTKLPSWATRTDLYYPPHLSMEQCSSEATARYKALIAGSGNRFVDLTTGFGVDAAYIAPHFKAATCVERQPLLTTITRHNFDVLGLNHVETINNDCTAYLHGMEATDLILIDPARRDDNGQRTYGMADCQPNVLEILGEMTSKAKRILIKLSPMLDVHKAVSDIKATGEGSVSTVHIVAVRNECKELLLEVVREDCPPLRTICVNLLADNRREVFEFETPAPAVNSQSPSTIKWNYLYEPNAAIMKAGCYNQLAAHFSIAQLDPNSHLFVAEQPVENFPGRRFAIETACSMNKKELKAAIGKVDRANIAVRNFPLTAKQLKERLKLGDGGDTYIFATTVKGERLLLIGHKVC